MGNTVNHGQHRKERSDGRETTERATRSVLSFGEEVGSWQLAVGSWQEAVGSWQEAVGSWHLAVIEAALSDKADPSHVSDSIRTLPTA